MNLGSTACQLCDLGEITQPLCKAGPLNNSLTGSRQEEIGAYGRKHLAHCKMVHVLILSASRVKVTFPGPATCREDGNRSLTLGLWGTHLPGWGCGCCQTPFREQMVLTVGTLSVPKDTQSPAEFPPASSLPRQYTGIQILGPSASAKSRSCLQREIYDKATARSMGACTNLHY